MDDIKLNLVREISDPKGSIIFLHGLGGDGKYTWTSEEIPESDSSSTIKVFWPEILAADFHELAVYTLDYPANPTNWFNNSRYSELPRVCIAILEYIIGKGIDRKPIILISHSLGGIVAKQLVKLSKSSRTKRLNTFAKNVKAISFIATPHAGSKWANVLNNINTVFPFLRTGNRINELESESIYLEELSRWYRDNIKPSYIETQAFYESKKTKQILIVNRMSADPNITGCIPIRLNYNHIDCCKTLSKDSQLYVTIVGLVQHHLNNPNYLDLDTELRPVTVVIGVIERNNKVLMVRRKNNIDGLTWQFPAGRLRFGEKEEECIVREVLEETDVKVRIKEKIGIRSGDETKTLRHYYACTYLDGIAKNNDPIENSDVAWVDLDKILDYITSKLNPDVQKYLKL